MPTPFLRRYFPSLPKEEAVERLLDNEYQLERITASDPQDTPFAEYLLYIHNAQAALSLNQLKATMGKNKTGTLAALTAVLMAPEPEGTPYFTPANILNHDLANRLHRLRTRGTAVEQILNNPTLTGNESPVLVEAARALKNGMMSTGRDQQEEFKDALGLFREAQEGAVGNRNYVVWFQIGWILWKQGTSLIEAEEAFYQAYRLSAATQDEFYYLSQRHRAYLQFLQNKPGEAQDTIARAISLYKDDPDIYKDAARYAVASGSIEDCILFVRKLLLVEPSCVKTIFADDVFATMLPALADTVWQLFEEGERMAANAVARLVKTKENIQIAAERSGVKIPLDEALSGGIVDAQALMQKHATAISYPIACGIVQEATTQIKRLYTHAQSVLEAENAAIELRLNRPRRQMERLLFDQKKWKEDVAKLERAARQSNVNLATPPKRNIFGQMNLEHATLYENYQTARGHAELHAEAIKDELPVHQAAIARGEEEQHRIATTIAWLEGEQGNLE